MATKKANTKSQSRAAKKVSVRDLAPKKRKGTVKGGEIIDYQKYEMGVLKSR